GRIRCLHRHPAVSLLPPAYLVVVAPGAELIFRRDRRAPGVIAAHAHMETVNIEPGARFRLEQMAVAGFHQLFLAIATDVELKIAAPLMRAIAQFTRSAAQAVFARENIRGV